MAKSKAKKTGVQVSSNVRLGVVRLIKKMKRTWLTLLHCRLNKDELDKYVSISNLQSPSHQFNPSMFSTYSSFSTNSSYHADDIANCIEFIKRTSAYSSPTSSIASSAAVASSSSSPTPSALYLPSPQ